MYNTIIALLDGTRFSEEIIPLVKKMTAERDAKRILLVRAVPPTPEVAVDYVLDPLQVAGVDAGNRAEAERYLKGIALQISGKGIECETVVLFGRVPDVLIEYARTSTADLIVMATHARTGISRVIYGSVAERMLQSVGIPILMLGGSGKKRPSIAHVHSRQPVRKARLGSQHAA